MNDLFIIYETYTNGYKAEILDIISLLAILCGILVIISKNPIVSVLFLIGLFASISCYLIMLGLSFIGLAYLIVYIGAVSILFLFILMLINIRISEIQSNTSNSILLAIAIAISFNYPVFQLLPYNIAIINNYYNLNLILQNISLNLNNKKINLNLYNDDIYFVTSKVWDGNLIENSHITSIGNVLYTNYNMWLILASFILLLAMVGSIVITIKPNGSTEVVQSLHRSNKHTSLSFNTRSYSTEAKNLILHPNWITGFSDGEASFSVSIGKAKNSKIGWQVVPRFAIELHVRDIDLLYRIKEFFGVGIIYELENKGHAVFAVYSIKDLLDVIIPHFDNYSLLTIKRLNFIYFKEIIELMGDKKHLTQEGLGRIVSIRAKMNKKTSIVSYTDPLIEIDEPKLLDLTKEDITPEWVVGFTDAEGCFYLNVRPNRSNNGYWVTSTFSLTQHSRDLLLFQLIVELLGFGVLREEKSGDVVRIRTDNFQTVCENVIPFFINYPLQSSKLLNFIDFCEACDLIKEKAHLTEEGIARIKELKSGMNTGRKDSTI